LQQPAESFGNDPSLEMLWAMKAYEHAETYFNILVCVDTRLLHLTPIDDDIYHQFRLHFPDLNVDCIDDAVMKSPEEKAKWRTVCYQFEGRVDDWNMATLLRLDSKKDVSESNTTIVPRIQFLAIEIARNREGYNSELRHQFSRYHRLKDSTKKDSES
jgi:hypothetical protein